MNEHWTFNLYQDSKLSDQKKKYSKRNKKITSPLRSVSLHRWDCSNLSGRARSLFGTSPDRMAYVIFEHVLYSDSSTFSTFTTSRNVTEKKYLEKLAENLSARKLYYSVGVPEFDNKEKKKKSWRIHFDAIRRASVLHLVFTTKSRTQKPSLCYPCHFIIEGRVYLKMANFILHINILYHKWSAVPDELTGRFDHRRGCSVRVHICNFSLARLYYWPALPLLWIHLKRSFLVARKIQWY